MIPQLVGLLLVVDARTRTEAVHAPAPYVLHLLFVKVKVFEHAVDVELGELEGSLVH